MDPMAVRSAFPSACGSFNLHPVWLAVHNYFINHRNQRNASERPFCFQLDGTEAGPEPAAMLLPFVPGEAGSSTTNIPAAIAAIVSSDSIWGSGARDATSWLP